MKKVILYIVASIDQRIAEPNGGTEWLGNFPLCEEMKNDLTAFAASVGTILMGGRSWRELSNMDALGAYSDKIIYVVSRQDWGAKENIIFITKDVIRSIGALRNEEPGGDIWLFGGGELTALLLEAGLVDEMQICYVPVILGNGIPLFPIQPKVSKWMLAESTAYSSGIIKIRYLLDN